MSDIVSELKRAEATRNSQSGEADVGDPHPVFDRLRERGDIHPSSLGELFGLADRAQIPPGTPRFTAIGYEAAETIARSPDFSARTGFEDPAFAGVRGSISMMDEPIHRRYRSLAQPAFAVRTMQMWEHRWFGPVVEALLAQLPRTGTFDVYHEYCARFPAETIVASFGLDPAQARRFHVLCLLMTGGGTPAEVTAATAEFDAEMTKIIESRRQDPKDDVIGVLSTSEVTDEEGSHRLTVEEILAFASVMITAGAGTTYRATGMLLRELAQRPDLYEEVRGEPSLLPALVEETLRYSPPMLTILRRAVVDTSVGGVEIPRGAIVDMVVGAANRDPRRWDNPHEWNPRRPLVPHLTFGSGVHFCIGNQLARMEMRSASQRVIDRYATFTLATDPDEVQARGLRFRFLPGLPVTVREGGGR